LPDDKGGGGDPTEAAGDFSLLDSTDLMLAPLDDLLPLAVSSILLRPLLVLLISGSELVDVLVVLAVLKSLVADGLEFASSEAAALFFFDLPPTAAGAPESGSGEGEDVNKAILGIVSPFLVISGAWTSQ
jgi:hypothetical protein